MQQLKHSHSILIAVPYGIETSGTIVFATRLHEQFRRKGFNSVLVAQGNYHNTEGEYSLIFPNESEMLDWIFKVGSTYDVLFWAGLCQDTVTRAAQIQQSVMLRSKQGNRVFFMWERTGEQIVVPEVELFELLHAHATDGIIVLNSGHEKELLDSSVPRNKLFLLSAGIDTTGEFTPISSAWERHQIRQQLGWNKQQIIGLFVGRFVHRKRVEFLLRTWIADPDLGHRAHLALTGSGFDAIDSVEHLIYQLARSSSSVTVSPIIYPRSQYYRASDFLVLPGVLEAEPTVLNEALACGLPVVASRIDGHTRLVIENRTGILFETDNQTQLNAALHDIIGNQHKRKLLGTEARRFAETHRDISVVADEFLSIFQK
ncbi:glycosyltransferase [bacterium]|nr:glycosyltransferase [bacterium]